MEVKRLNPVPTGHRRLLKWVEYWARLCEPIGVYWCDGSRGEYDGLMRGAIESGLAGGADVFRALRTWKDRDYD